MDRQTRRSGPRISQAVLVIAMGMATPPVPAITLPQAVWDDADALTWIAIAHYEENDFGHVFSEFVGAVQCGNRFAQFSYVVMLMRGEGTVAWPDEAVK